jgi:hypothetical protein
VPEASKKAKPVLLVKWWFVRGKKGEAGEARYWWSDGSKTKDEVASHTDAVSRLKIIQDNGGIQSGAPDDYSYS